MSLMKMIRNISNYGLNTLFIRFINDADTMVKAKDIRISSQ